jgi:adenylate kinase family enzyme
VARKIQVKGSSGSGKTTFSRALAERLGLPFVELDALHHGPNWTEATPEEFRAKVAPIVAQEAWVIDGNYESKLGDLVLSEAELVVWLDLPLREKLRRLWRRTTRRIREDELLWSGNKENWRSAVWSRDSLFYWAVRGHFRQRRAFPWGVPPERIVRLRSSADARRWLDSQG